LYTQSAFLQWAAIIKCLQMLLKSGNQNSRKARKQKQLEHDLSIPPKKAQMENKQSASKILNVAEEP